MIRNIIIVVIIFLAAAAGFVYFTKDEISFTRESSAYKAVPVSTPFLFEFRSLKSVPMENPALQELLKMDLGNAFFNKIMEADSLIRNLEQLPKNLRNEPFILAFDFTGRNQLEPLFIKKIDNNNERKAFLNLIQLFYPTSQYTYSERNYSNYKITEIKSTENTDEPGIYYSFSGGVFLGSSKSILVEQAIRQLSATGILNNNYFTQVNRTVTSQSEISFYINHTEFPAYLRNLLSSQSNKNVNEFGETETTNYGQSVLGFEDFAAWTELDFNFDDDHFSLGGISAADDSLNHFLSVFKGQETMRFRADEVLPRNTSFFCCYAFPEKEKFLDGLENYFMHSDYYYKREEIIKKMESGFRTNLKTVLTEIVKDEVIVATSAIPVNPDNKTSYFIMHTEGKSGTEEKLTDLLSAYASRKDVSLNDLITIYAVDDELKYKIYTFPYPSLPGYWLGKPFGMSEARFATVYDNYLVFSNSEKGLQEYLHNMALDNTLAKDIRYLRFKQKISNRANINIYLDVNRVYSFGNHIFSDEVSELLEQNEESFRKFWAANWQVQRSKDVYFNSVFVGFNEKAKEEAQTTWQSIIGSRINFKPQIVTNHDDPDNHEIVVQDEQNSLHQVTKDGRIRWSLPLPDNIMSKIHQIDYYKNGKLQYLFNTKKRLYIIDRNGNNVAHFPVTLRSPATNGVNVFDYEKSRNYRYFVAGEDKKIYAYDYAGRVVSGWDFGKTDHQVSTPVEHFRINRKDYIVFKDKSRIYITDRRGHTRVETAARFENSRNPLVLNLDGLPKIVTTDVEGKVYYIFFNGKYEVKDVGDFSADHYFICEDLNGNNVPDFVFVDENKLEVMDENGKELYDEKFGNTINHPPNIYNFGPKSQKIGIVEAAANRIYLFNTDGDLHDGFPLQGSSEFSIGILTEKSGQLNLVVGSEGGSLFNYTLN